MTNSVSVSGNNNTNTVHTSSTSAIGNVDTSTATNSINVAGIGDGAWHWAKQAELSAEEARQQAELAEYYASQSVSALWIKIARSDWVLDSNLYKYKIDGILAVLSVYEGNWENKQLITSIDITVTDFDTTLFTHTPFSGYVLVSKSILESEDYTPATVDTLAAMLEVDIIDITT